MKFAEVYLNQKNKRIDQPYDYKIPMDLETVIVPGVRVVVGFGKGNRQLEGFVIHVKEHTDFPNKIKEIKTNIDKEPILTKEQIALCRWMKSYYCSLFYEVLNHFTHPVKVVKRSVIAMEDPRKSVLSFEPYTSTEKVYALTEPMKVKGSVQQKILNLLENRDCTRRELLDMLGDVGGSIRSLEKKGLIKAYERETCGAFEKHHRLDVIDLSAEQNNFYEKYQALAFEKSPCFIWGYDLYSKVRLYAKLSEDCLKKGKTTVILFPEIGLTLEKKAFFYQVFGNEAAICHGKMGDKEKYHMYRRVRCGEVKVLIGSRSALFMPMKNLGLIIVDEQRDPSYYSVAMPKYNTIDVAEHYAALCGAKLLASDEIPSVSALYKIEQGSWSVIKGNEAGKEKRAVDVIDMQQEMKNGNYDFMSVALKEKIDEAMALERVSLLMINKRGYASYVFCRNCGHVEKCPTCGVALKYYAGSGVLKCHYCGYTKNNSHVCPACAQKKMKALGLGIDQVYELLIKRYPNARILKIDSETVPDHETFKTINQGLLENQWDIIIGTRMMLRNFKYTKVGTAAALLIDGDLNHGDYTSAENAYQLYSKFFKKMDLPDGRALVQTYEPDNLTIEALVGEDEMGFYKTEMAYRSLMGYPPGHHMVVFSLFHQERERVRVDSEQFYDVLLGAIKKNGFQKELKVFVPVLSGIIRGNGQIRWKIVLKTDHLSFFHGIIEKILEEGEIEALESKVSIEIDPPSTL